MRRSFVYASIALIFLCLKNNATAQVNQTVTNGDSTAVVSFPGMGCTYNWVNNTPGIGLAASGSGSIASFRAVNTTGAPVTATITATPSAGGFAYIANGNANVVTVINTLTNTVAGTIAAGVDPYAVAVSPDGSRVYVTNDGPVTNNTYYVTVINTANNSVITTIPVGIHPEGIAISPDGSRVYVTNGNSNNVSVINTTSNTVIATIPVDMAPLGVAVSPDGKTVYVANLFSNDVSVISAATNTVINSIPVGKEPNYIAISPDGSRLYVANQGTVNVSVINTATGTVINNITGGVSPQVVTLSPDGSRLYIRYLNSGNIVVANTATNAVMDTITVNSLALGMSVSPDGSRLYVVSFVNGATSSNVAVVNTATDKIIANVTISPGATSIGNFVSGGIGCTGPPLTFTITVNPTTAVITPTGTLAALNTVYGTPSAPGSFSVSGVQVTGGILVTSPPGFEVSLDGVTFSAAVTVAGSGTIAATPVYIRLTDTTAAGSYAGNIMLSSAGVLHINVAMPASEVSPAPLTITANNQTRAYGTANPAFTVTYSGFVNNQGPASLTALPVATTTAAVNSLPGQYPITAGGAASPDYSFTYFPGVLTITAGFANTIIPNAFTPNGDGINDTWNIQYLSTYPNCTVQIFNRYGQKLFYSEGYPLPWDGTYNGVKVPDGIYYYIINLNGGQSSIAGHVTVIR